MKMPFDEAMRVKDQMPKGLFRNVDGQTADTIWLCAIDAAEQYHGIPRKPLTDDEIPALAEQVLKLSVYYDVWALLGTDGLVALVRAVEAKHGIKESP